MKYLFDKRFEVEGEILDIDKEINRLKELRNNLEKERIRIHKLIKENCNHELKFVFTQASVNFYHCDKCNIYKSKTVDPYTKKESVCWNS